MLSSLALFSIAHGEYLFPLIYLLVDIANISLHLLFQNLTYSFFTVLDYFDDSGIFRVNFEASNSPNR